MARKARSEDQEALLAAIDRHVGSQIRTRRRELGLSQAELAARVGVASQQVAKYETGDNGVPAARLWLVARALGASPDTLFAGVDVGLGAGAEPSPVDPERLARSIRQSEEGLQLAELFRRISNRRTRDLLMTLSRELASRD